MKDQTKDKKILKYIREGRSLYLDPSDEPYLSSAIRIYLKEGWGDLSEEVVESNVRTAAEELRTENAFEITRDLNFNGSSYHEAVLAKREQIQRHQNERNIIRYLKEGDEETIRDISLSGSLEEKLHFLERTLTCFFEDECPRIRSVASKVIYALEKLRSGQDLAELFKEIRSDPNSYGNERD